MYQEYCKEVKEGRVREKPDPRIFELFKHQRRLADDLNVQAINKQHKEDFISGGKIILEDLIIVTICSTISNHFVDFLINMPYSFQNKHLI